MENGCIFSQKLFPSFVIVLYNFGFKYFSSFYNGAEFNKYSAFGTCAFVYVPLYKFHCFSDIVIL